MSEGKGAVRPAVSIVIPCYNVEAYLPEVLDSVLGQTLENIEAICVNDGSTDGTLDVIKSYAARDSRIVIIDKPNGGYGHSMNKGMDMATGEYIGIVESDDYILPTMYEKLYAAQKKTTSISFAPTSRSSRRAQTANAYSGRRS